MQHYGPKATQALLQAKELEARGYTVWLAPEYLQRLDTYEVDDWDFADIVDDVLLMVFRGGHSLQVESVGDRHLRLLRNDDLVAALGEDSWQVVDEYRNQQLPVAERMLFKTIGDGHSFMFAGQEYRFEVRQNGWFEDFYGLVEGDATVIQDSVSEPYYFPPLPFEMADALEDLLKTRASEQLA